MTVFCSCLRWCRCHVSFVFVLIAIVSCAQNDTQVAVSADVTVSSVLEDPNRRETLKLISDTEAALTDRQFLSAAESFDAAWALAVRHEDPLLSLNTGVSGALQPGEHRLQAGARSRLEQLYVSAPDEFRRLYLQRVTAAAKRAADTATISGQTEDLVQFILRYQFTNTAQQALRKLVQLRLSRGEFLQGALQYGRLLRLQENNDAGEWASLATLWWKAGLPEEALDYLREAVADAPGQPVSICGQQVSLPKDVQNLSSWISETVRLVPVPASTTSEWLQPGGNYRRTIKQATNPLLLDKVWSKSTFYCLQFPEVNPILGPLAATISSRATLGQAAGETFLPAARPLVVDDMLIYRCVANIQAVDRNTGQIRWETLPLDRQIEQAVESLKRTGAEEQNKLKLIQRQLGSELASHLSRANCAGQLTSDGRLLFAVEDSTAETMEVDLDEQLPRTQVPVNYLRVYDVQSGAFLGQAGGHSGATGRGGRANPMAGMYFLGSPLVLGDRVYVMAENDQGIFLVQLNARHPWGKDGRSEIDLHPVSSQLLTIPRYSLRQHPVRKYSGVIPSYSRGLLICNTCDEQVIAVSAEDHSVRWIHRYSGNIATTELSVGAPRIGNASNERASQRIDRSSRWLDALPRIAGGRILLTPRDSDRLLCLDLQTGQELWSRPQGKLRKIAAVNDDRVVLTGMTVVECLEAASGEQVWSTEIAEGNICGNSCSSGELLHVPTSAPGIVTLSLTTGRKLVSQPIPDNTAGNLVSVDNSLFTQTISGVSCLRVPSGAEQSPLANATKDFFEGRPENAERRLEHALQEPDTSVADRRMARGILTTSLLESIRLDYSANRQRESRLRQLLLQTSDSDAQLIDVVASMVGMSISDAAVFPVVWKDISRQEKYRSQLDHLVARGTLNDLHQSADGVTSAIVNVLTAASGQPNHVESSSQLTWRSHRQLGVTIRAAMKLRTESQQAEIRKLASVELLNRISAAATPDEAQWWIEMCLLSGFIEPAMESISENSGVTIPAETASAFTELVLFDGLNSSQGDVADSAMMRLMSLWKALNREDLVTCVADRTGDYHCDSAPAVKVTKPSFGRSLIFSSIGALSETTSSLLAPHRDPPASHLSMPPWGGVSKVVPTAAHSARPGAMVDSLENPIQSLIPVFGQMGAFSGWEFSITADSNVLHAYDSQGRNRWQFDLGPIRKRRGYRSRISDQYIVAYGNLLAVKIHHRFFMLNCASATKSVSPQRLWELNLSTFGGSEFADSDFVPAYERSVQYAIQPTGLRPVGPMSHYGIAMCFGGQLIVRNTLTGRTEWRATGIPTDAALTANDQELCVISEASGQVEVRSMIDGAILRTHTLPEWWTDATENSAVSIRDFELEPVEQQRFRIEVRNNHSLLFRRNTEASFIELFNLAHDEAVWSFALPAESVVSNPVNGRVAILSDGTRLQLLDTITGQRVTDQMVPAASDSRFLYLRPSTGHWLVMTDVFDSDWSNNFHTIGNSVPVNGFLYAVDRTDGNLAWHVPIEKEFLRIANAPPGIPASVPTTVPLLLLMKRPWAEVTAEGIRRSAKYQARFIDVRTGKVIFHDKDLGLNLSNHRIRLDDTHSKVEFAFNKRNVLFDYSEHAQEGK